MKLGIDFFGISEEEHAVKTARPIRESKNSLAEYNRQLNELNEYMDTLAVLFKIRERYMEEE